MDLKRVQEFIHNAGLTDFVIVEFLGKGSFGDVYKAKRKNDPSGSFYAIKIINRRLSEKQKWVKETSFIEKFYKLIQDCCPSCVVKIYPEYIKEWIEKKDIGYKTEKFYNLIIVADYIPLTLDKPEVYSLPLKEKLEILLKLGECLKNFLSKGLVYTDLKPQNIGLSQSSDAPIIIDLGGFYSTEKAKALIEATISRSSSGGIQYSRWFAPPEFFFNKN